LISLLNFQTSEQKVELRRVFFKLKEQSVTLAPREISDSDVEVLLACFVAISRVKISRELCYIWALAKYLIAQKP
jgi:hypothetical protein